MHGNSTGANPTPAMMRALELRSYDGRLDSLSVVMKPVARPAHGQVLVRMAAAPVNPSDLMFIRGLYGFKKKLPVVPGFEGSGVVVAGGGLLGRALVGRRVACAALTSGDGTWAEYMVTSANLCMPLRRQVNAEQGATMLVNPLTAWALMERARVDQHRAVVQTAAASALGRMILRLGQRFAIPVVNVVRRKEQADLLRQLGAGHVVDSSDPQFDKVLRDLCCDLSATLAFDAVAGEMSGRLLRAMPRGGRVLVYGALSLQACQVDPASLIFEGKRLEGFWLSDWLRRKSLVGRIRIASRIQALLARDLKTEVQARVALEDAARGLEQYVGNMTAGKVLFVP